MTEWHVYIVRAVDGSLYTGIATDVARRIAEHVDGGKGAKYLRGRAPLELVFQEKVGDRGLALRAERRLKSLAKPAKESLVAAQPDRSALLDLIGLDGD